MKRVRPYEHKVQYYETDQMKVVHHSNYIRWFEEARTNFMERMGLGYDEMEKRGIMSPVLEVQANYLKMIRFGDTVSIKSEIKTYNGIKLIIGYQIKSKQTGLVHCTGETKHCFLNEQMKPISLKKECEEFHNLFMEYVDKETSKKRGNKNED